MAAVTVGLVVLLALALAVGGGGPGALAPGLDQAGPLVDRGLPIARLAARVAALGTVGALLFAAFLRPSGRSLPAASRRAVRAASRWALAWAGTTAVGAALTLSRLVGVPPTALTSSSVQVFVTDLASGRAAVLATAVAAFLAVAAGRCRSSVAAAGLLAVALAGLVVPAVLTGHSATADHHLLAVVNLSVHVVSATVWVGGLLALLLYGRSREDLAPAAARVSVLALGCFLATGASGLLAAWLVLGGGTAGPAGVVGTGYGWLLIGKTAGLAALGAFGWHHRRRTLPALSAGRHGAFGRFAAGETVVMLATIAVAVALSASPPPVAAPPAAAQNGAQPADPGLGAAVPSGPGIEDMAGHDHGDLSVTVLVDEFRFHVSAPVDAGARVTVHNGTSTDVTITASDGSFDVVVPGGSLMTFPAPDEPGAHPFASRHSPSFTGVLVVR
ncbi:CopD family protein [Modestobacter lapidis]